MHSPSTQIRSCSHPQPTGSPLLDAHMCGGLISVVGWWVLPSRARFCSKTAQHVTLYGDSFSAITLRNPYLLNWEGRMHCETSRCSWPACSESARISLLSSPYGSLSKIAYHVVLSCLKHAFFHHPLRVFCSKNREILIVCKPSRLFSVGGFPSCPFSKRKFPCPALVWKFMENRLSIWLRPTALQSPSCWPLLCPSRKILSAFLSAIRSIFTHFPETGEELETGRSVYLSAD